MDFNGMLEYWCSIYKPILHNRDGIGKRFFLMEPKQSVGQFAKKLDEECTPCVAVKDNTSGKWKNHTFHFLVRPEINSAIEKESKELIAEYEAERFFHDFFKWMRNKQQEESLYDSDIINVINGISIETASWWNCKGNGWVWIGVRIRDKKK